MNLLSSRDLKQDRKKEEVERRQMNNEEWTTWRAKWWSNNCVDSFRTCSVFISSTFNDMHGERDYITRFVFPELNNKLKSRGIRAIPIDLRWGLTQEDTSDEGLGALEHCLMEIDHSRPFFVLLQGSRYGWVPPDYKISNKPEFEWVKSFPKGHSITAMEAYYGFLRCPFTPVYAFCYIRNPLFLNSIKDPEEKAVFLDCDNPEEKNRRREELLVKINEHPYCRVREYTCTYGGKDTEGKPYVTNLEKFGQTLLDDLFNAITCEFSEPPKPLTPVEEEKSYHFNFIRDRICIFRGRDKILNILFKHANGEWQTNDKTNTDNGKLPLVVIGDPGSGKSSVIAAFAHKYIHQYPNKIVITHIVGASPKSIDIRFTLIRFMNELFTYFPEIQMPTDNDYVTVKHAFYNALEKISDSCEKRQTNLIFIIDGLNQFLPLYSAHSLDWLPYKLLPNIRWIVSTTKEGYGINVLQAIRKREQKPGQLIISPLTVEEQKEIIVSQLSLYSKKLTKEQLAMLCKKDDSSKPLYLLIACEELRYVGLYGSNGSEIDNKIESFPPKVGEIFMCVLDRVERDMQLWARDYCSTLPLDNSAEEKMIYFGAAIVKYALCYVDCSRQGINENELMELLAPPNSDKLPHAIWSRLYRSLELYLKSTEIHGNNTITFFHGQLSVAVKKRYLDNDNNDMRSHIYQNFCDYYKLKSDPTGELLWNTDNENGLIELPYYYTVAYNYLGIKETLCNLNFILARCKLGLYSIENLIRDYKFCIDFYKGTGGDAFREMLNGNLTSSNQFFLTISDFLIFVSSHRKLLLDNPLVIFELALNSPDSTAPYLEALRHIQRGYAPISWLEFISKPTDNNLLSEFSGYNSPVTAVAVHPDATVTLVGCQDGSIRIIDTITGEILHECIIDGHTKRINSLSFDHEGLKFVSASDDNSIICWDTSTGSKLGKNDDTHIHPVTFALFTPTAVEGRLYVASGSTDMSIRIWNLVVSDDETMYFKELSCKDWISNVPLCATFTADGNMLITGCKDGFVSLYDLRNPTVSIDEIVKFDAHEQSVTAIAYRSNDSLLATGSEDCLVKIWRIQLKYASDSMPNLVYEFNYHTASITAITFSFDNAFLITADSNSKIHIWDSKTKEKITSIIGHHKAISAVCFPPKSQILLTASLDMTIKQWNVHNIRQENKDKISRYITTTENLNVIQKRKLDRFKVNFSQIIANTPTGFHTHKVSAIALSNDGSLCCSGSEDLTVKLWNVKTNKEIAALVGHVNTITFVAITNNNDIVSGDMCGIIFIWKCEYNQYKHYLTLNSNIYEDTGVNSPLPSSREIHGLTAGAINSTSTFIFCGYEDGRLRKFNIKDGFACKVGLECSHQYSVCKVACPNDKRVLTADTSGTIKVWNEELQSVTILNGNENPILDISFTNKNSRIVSIAKDKYVHCWDRYHKIYQPFQIPKELVENEPICATISSRCDFVLITGEDHIFKVIDISTRDEYILLGSFIPFGQICCSTISKNDIIACGDSTGRVFFLQVVSLEKHHYNEEICDLPTLTLSPINKPHIDEKYVPEIDLPPIEDESIVIPKTELPSFSRQNSPKKQRTFAITPKSVRNSSRSSRNATPKPLLTASTPIVQSPKHTCFPFINTPNFTDDDDSTPSSYRSEQVQPPPQQQQEKEKEENKSPLRKEEIVVDEKEEEELEKEKEQQQQQESVSDRKKSKTGLSIKITDSNIEEEKVIVSPIKQDQLNSIILEPPSTNKSFHSLVPSPLKPTPQHGQPTIFQKEILEMPSIMYFGDDNNKKKNNKIDLTIKASYPKRTLEDDYSDISSDSDSEDYSEEIIPKHQFNPLFLPSPKKIMPRMGTPELPKKIKSCKTTLSILSPTDLILVSSIPAKTIHIKENPPRISGDNIVSPINQQKLENSKKDNNKNHNKQPTMHTTLLLPSEMINKDENSEKRKSLKHYRDSFVHKFLPSLKNTLNRKVVKSKDGNGDNNDNKNKRLDYDLTPLVSPTSEDEDDINRDSNLDFLRIPSSNTTSNRNSQVSQNNSINNEIKYYNISNKKRKNNNNSNGNGNNSSLSRNNSNNNSRSRIVKPYIIPKSNIFYMNNNKTICVKCPPVMIDRQMKVCASQIFACMEFIVSNNQSFVYFLGDIIAYSINPDPIYHIMKTVILPRILRFHNCNVNIFNSDNNFLELYCELIKNCNNHAVNPLMLIKKYEEEMNKTVQINEMISNCILVDSKDHLDEVYITKSVLCYMYSILKTGGIIVVNGDNNELSYLCQFAYTGIPIIIFDGSGGICDMISLCIKHHRYPNPSLFNINDLVTVCEGCDLYIYNINDPIEIVEDLMENIFFHKTKVVTTNEVDNNNNPNNNNPLFHSSVIKFPFTNSNNDKGNVKVKAGGAIGASILDHNKISRANQNGFYNTHKCLKGSKSMFDMPLLPPICPLKKEGVAPVPSIHSITLFGRTY